MEDGWVLEFALVGELAELPVGHGAPEGVAEAGSQGMVVELAWLFEEGVEAWGAEDGTVGGFEGVRDGGIRAVEFLVGQFDVGLGLLERGRAAEGDVGEAPDGLVEEVFLFFHGVQGLEGFFRKSCQETGFDFRRIPLGMYAFDGDAGCCDARESLLHEVTALVGDVSPSGPSGGGLEGCVIGFEFQGVTLLDPGFVGEFTFIVGCFYEADGDHHGRGGTVGPGAECAPDDLVGTRIDGLYVVECDFVPTGLRDFGLVHAPVELDAHFVGDDPFVPCFGAAVVAAAWFGKVLRGVVLFVGLGGCEGQAEGFFEGKVCSIKVAREVKVGELLGFGHGLNAVGGGLFWEQVEQGDVDREQVLDSVFVLLAGQAAGLDAPGLELVPAVG